MRPDVVHAEERRATSEGRDSGADRRRVRPDPRVRLAHDRCEGRLPREPHEHRAAECDDPVEPADELEILVGCLAEADSRIDADAAPRRCPAATASPTRSPRNAVTSSTTSSYLGASCIVAGSPCMCMRQMPTPASATTAASSGSRRSAVTSFTIVAPSAIARRATSAREVSTETRHPTRSSSTGTTRLSSSSSLTGSAPGRVDSPPTSTSAAPSASICRAASAAASGEAYDPPSEKLSGVTLTIPTTAGRGQRSSFAGRLIVHGR